MARTKGSKDKGQRKPGSGRPRNEVKTTVLFRRVPADLYYQLVQKVDSEVEAYWLAKNNNAGNQ